MMSESGQDNSDREHVFKRANEASSRQEWAEAVKLYQNFLAAQPDHEWALNNCGFCLSRLERWGEAEGLLVRALRVNPENRKALANLVMVLESAGDKLAAIPFRKTLAQLEPAGFDNLFHLANSLMSGGCADEALHYYRRAIRIAPDHRVCRSNYLLTTNYAPSLSVNEIAREHFRHAQAWLRNNDLPRYPDKPEIVNEPLRIGYLSPDFAHHPVGKIMTAILQQHDRSKYHIICYSDRGEADGWTEKVQSAVDECHSIHQLSDRQLLERMRADRLAVSIELAGHTGGRNRLRVFAARVAPLQISFLGYPNTTGMEGIDGFITDRYCDPPGSSEDLHAEPLIRLESGFLCFDPWLSPLPNTPSPCLESEYVTFGSFNNPAKVSPPALDAWAEIMRRAPNVRLLVKYGGKFKSAWLRDRWRTAFGERGIAPSRIRFMKADPTLAGHYERLASVDLSLDPFPYQGTTTTLEALSAGCPVLTRAGETYCQRASSALLLRLRLGELVSGSNEDYVERAVALANDPAELDRLRRRVQTEFPRSSIRDCAGFVREFEATLESLLRLHGVRRQQVDASRSPDETSPVSGVSGPTPASAVVPQADATGRVDHPSENRILVTCTGMPRSGSTWAYNVVRLLLQYTYGEAQIQAIYREGPSADEALRVARSDDRHLVLKLHYPEAGVMSAVRDGVVRNIYTSRHPLAALASFREKFGGRTSEIARRLRHSLEAADEWRRLGTATLFVAFDDLVSEPVVQVKRTAEYLGLAADDELIKRVAQETSLESVQRVTRDLAKGARGKPLERVAGSVYDPVTQYHANHAPKSTSRDWRTELSEEDLETAAGILGRWLPEDILKPSQAGAD